MIKKILIVEDEIYISQVLYSYLSKANYICHVINDGQEVDAWVKQHEPAMVLLDVNLPGKDGFALCESIRSYSNVPIVMITGKAEEEDRLVGLDHGADDYICKPFHPREVVARVKAIFRRMDMPQFTVDENSESGNDFVLDIKRHRLLVRGNEIALTAIQCNLLALLMDNEGTILSREQVMESIYPDERVVSNRTVDTHIRELRRHISRLVPQEVIFSVYGSGYKFAKPLD